MLKLLPSRHPGSGQRYVPVQGRIYPDGRLHIQGKGPTVNRAYGVAVDVSIPDELKNWWEAGNHYYASHANSTAKYMAFQIRNRGKEVHAQIQRPSGLNREYGASFTITGAPAETLRKFIDDYIAQ